MSGSLQASEYLQASPNLRALLGCVIPALGRVYLFQQTGAAAPAISLYHNDAHSLFYQTHLIPLGNHYLLLETRRKNPAETAKALFAVEYLPQTLLTISSQTTLKPASPGLDVLTPVQVEHYMDSVLTQCLPHLSEADGNILTARSERFLQRWQQCYTQFVNSYAGEWSYQSALNAFRDTLMPLALAVTKTLAEPEKQLTEQALNIIATQLDMLPPAPRRVDRKLLLKTRRRQQFQVDSPEVVPRFQRPVFIVSIPRAGSTLLFETLSQFHEIWSTGEENHALLEDIPGLHPHDHGFVSNRLEASDATDTVRMRLLQAFTSKLHDREQQYYLALPAQQRPATIRFLEKTPKNALRIPFLKALFPDALFIYLHRDFHSNVSSLIDGWRSRRFIAYRDLPGFENRHWRFLLIPGWRELHDRSIADIASQQWAVGNQIIRDDLARLPEQDWMSIDYHNLINHPGEVIRRFAGFAGLEWDDVVQHRCQNTLPVSRLTLSAPQKHKWKKHLHLLDTHQRCNMPN